MSKSKKNQKGFTLIELLVVVIIVAVLAAVGIPLLAGNIERARASEAQAGLGTIRTQLRALQAEDNIPTQAAVRVIDQYTPLVSSFDDGDLTGRWFEDDDYQLSSTAATSVAGAQYCIRVRGDAAVGATGTPAQTAPEGAQVDAVDFSMDQDGDLYDTTACTGTPIN